jgi:hypothetical protein
MRIRNYVISLTTGLIAMLSGFVPAQANDCGKAYGGLSTCHQNCVVGGWVNILGVPINLPPNGCYLCDAAEKQIDKYCPVQAFERMASQKKRLNAHELASLQAHLKGISQGSGKRVIRASKTLNVDHSQSTSSKHSTKSLQNTSHHLQGTSSRTSAKIITHSNSNSSSNQSNQILHTPTMERLNTPRTQIK